MKAIRVFSAGEKGTLAGQLFSDVSLDRVDFSGADLRGARFDSVSLRGCDFRSADLRGAEFVGCDLRDAFLRDVLLGDNRFDGSFLAGVTGLTVDQTRYVFGCGGLFVAPDDRPTKRSS